MTSASFASAWRAHRHVVEGGGHINSESGLGDWRAGAELLDTLTGPSR